MKKYTADELLAMDSDKLRDLRSKLWEVRDVLRAQEGREPILSSYDIRGIIDATTKSVAILGAAYIGYRAVKYYTDKKFPSQEVNK